MTLAFYVARRFLKMFLGVFAVFFAILFMIEVIEKIRDLGGETGMAGVVRIALLNTPSGLYRILPLVTILAAVAMFLAMARSSELVVIRAAGRSALRTLAAPVTVAFLLGALAVAVMNPMVAATQKLADSEAAKLSNSTRSVLSVGREGLWLRQGGPDGQSVIRAERANLDGTRLFDATFLTFDAEGPTQRLEADGAVLTDQGWVLSNVKEWRFRDSENPERDASTYVSLTVPSELTAARIRDSFGTPSEIPIWQLPDFIHGLEAAGFSARRHAVWFQMELALPLMLAAMVLMGAGFTMRHARFGKTGIMVLFALASGFGIFFLRNFAQILGENGQIPVALAAWSPPVAAVMLSLGLLLHLEDG